jgi:PKD repeat protein
VVTWDFDDGSAPAAGEEATHVFAHPGSYSVTAIVEDDDGGSDEDELAVVVTEYFSVHLPVILR